MVLNGHVSRGKNSKLWPSEMFGNCKRCCAYAFGAFRQWYGETHSKMYGPSCCSPHVLSVKFLFQTVEWAFGWAESTAFGGLISWPRINSRLWTVSIVESSERRYPFLIEIDMWRDYIWLSLSESLKFSTQTPLTHFTKPSSRIVSF